VAHLVRNYSREVLLLRAIVHIAGRPDPDGKQRCVFCRHELTKGWPMGSDVAEIPHLATVSIGGIPDKYVVVRCTAL
jgi:hypothetical protein